MVDVAIYEDGIVIDELQLKATDDIGYINSTFEENPGTLIVATSEVASQMDSDMVINSGITEDCLDTLVGETLFSELINPISPLSIAG